MTTHPNFQDSLKQSDDLARLLDNQFKIPFVPVRIGFDSIIGLIPGIGDLAGGLLSMVIVGHAIKMKVPLHIILFMLINIGLDTFIGAIPILGDIFDIMFKCNKRNADLLRKFSE